MSPRRGRVSPAAAQYVRCLMISRLHQGVNKYIRFFPGSLLNFPMANQDEIVSFEAPNVTTLALPFPCVNSGRYQPRTQDHLGGLATWEYNHRDQRHGEHGMSLRRHPRAVEPGKVCAPFEILRHLSLSLTYDDFRSKHPTSEKIIKRVQEDFNRFFDTLIKSKDVARNGCKAMTNIAYICSQLSSPTKPREQLKIFVDQVSVPVGEAEKQSKLIRVEFRQARIRVIEVSP